MSDRDSLREELTAIDRRIPEVTRRRVTLELKRRDAYACEVAAKLLGLSYSEFVRRAAVSRAQKILARNYRSKGLGLGEASADARAGLRVNPKTEKHRAKWRKK